MDYKFYVLVVGAGGTGTYFLKEAGRFLSSDIDLRSKVSKFIIADGDHIEEKNLSRQCFTKEDIGRNKAAVMAEVLNATFSLNIMAYPHFIVSLNSLKELLKTSDCLPVIIGCSDNHALRLLCEQFFEAVPNCIYFDSANEFSTGEVVFSYKVKGRVLGPCRSFYFPDIREGDLRSVTEMSCEELNNSAPQHIFTNMTAGLQLCSGFCNLLQGKLHPGHIMFNPFEFCYDFTPYQLCTHHQKGSEGK